MRKSVAIGKFIFLMGDFLMGSGFLIGGLASNFQ
jgi:hypothetical protein